MSTRLRYGAALAAALAAAFTHDSNAQPCTPVFADRFAAADINNSVLSMTSFDDGSGTALYAGGAFTVASGTTVNRIAKWTLQGWEPLATGFNSTVNAVVVFDDGNGPALYAAGAFTSAGALGRLRIARWEGNTWGDVGSGFNSTVNALAVFDEDGAGPAPPRLFAGGAFTTAGGLAAQRIAKWDGSTWSPVGSGCDATVESLHVHTQGGATSLYVGGSFANAGGTTVNNIARWDGTAFHALGSGTTGAVNAIASFDADGPGGAPPDLIAGGSFLIAGAVSANRIARWDGTDWFDLAGGVNSTVQTMFVYDDGSGADLFVGGSFSLAGGSAAGRMARWDGSMWNPVTPTGFNSTVFSLAAHDDGRGQRLIAGGAFGTVDGSSAQRIAGFDGTVWSGLDRGANGRVEALGVHDDGTGPAIYLGGTFDRLDGMPVVQTARYQDGEFTPLGGGINNGTVLAFATYDEGAGPRLFAGGTFTLVQGVATNRIARWDGSTWTPVLVMSTNGVNGAISAMLPWNDGSGLSLFAGGAFSNAGGSATARIAKWDGTVWSPLDTGLNNAVNALAVHNDGSGEALYAGGVFTVAGGTAVGRVARWNGTAWSDVGGGMNNTVHALASYQGHLYAGGTFSLAGTASVNRVARWDGSAWADVGAGVNSTVRTMAVFDENGSAAGGEMLYVGGQFTTAGGVSVERIARWDGSAWSALGPLASPGADNTVYAMAAINTGPNSGLYIGGDMLAVGTQSAARLARWGCEPCYANCDSSGTIPILNVADFGCFLQQFAAGDIYANCDGSSMAPVLNVADFGCFLQKFAAGCP